MTGPFHDDVGRDSHGQGLDDEGAAKVIGIGMPKAEKQQKRNISRTGSSLELERSRSLRRLEFDKQCEQDTKGEKFHVLTLVDGDNVLVRSKEHPERCFKMEFMDIVCVPAYMGKYEIVNLCLPFPPSALWARSRTWITQRSMD